MLAYHRPRHKAHFQTTSRYIWPQKLGVQAHKGSMAQRGRPTVDDAQSKMRSVDFDAGSSGSGALDSAAGAASLAPFNLLAALKVADFASASSAAFLASSAFF
mmetsp:Transcript_26578/g.74703  ORF Transcript_26578/g.74703 Transcript_26578/m.74703 type:complete len:103 (+) Transcript_26578:306-614(+)